MDAEASEQRGAAHCMQDVDDDGGCVFDRCTSCVCTFTSVCVCVSLSGGHRLRGNPTSITGSASNTHSV